MGAAWRGPKDARPRARCRDGARGEGARPGDLRHARHARGRPGRAAEGRRASTTTTTTSTPRPSSTATSSRTRDYQDRLDTLDHVRDAGINVCCGGIVGMGETRAQRAGLIAQLANLDPYPESVPINNLVQVEGTPLHGTRRRSTRSSSCAPSPWRASRCRRRWCACRPAASEMGEAVQALCFLAGANSIFYGDKLLTTGNPDVQRRPRAARQARDDRVMSGTATSRAARKPVTLHRLREMHARRRTDRDAHLLRRELRARARRRRRRLPAGRRFARHGAAGPDQHAAGHARRDGLSHALRRARQSHAPG